MSVPNFVTAKAKKQDIDGMKNSELNMLLGEGGTPKYSVNQLKSKTKAQLQDELLGIMTDYEEAHPAPVKKERTGAAGPKGAIQKISKNRDVAASKKCRLLAALAAKTKTLVEVVDAYNFDTVLQEYCPADVFTRLCAEAQNGVRPKKQKLVQLPMFQD